MDEIRIKLAKTRADFILSDSHDDALVFRQIQRLQGLVEQFQTLLNSQQTSQRVAYTLAALDSLGRYLAGMPGRKNLLLPAEYSAGS